MLEYGSEINPPTVSRVGYTFLHWHQEVDSIVPAHDVEYIANWTVNAHTLTFNANGGEGGWQATTNYGASITPPTPTRTGYTFDGWNPTPPSIMSDEDLTFVAQWKANSYTITFDADGGYGGWSKPLEYESKLEAPIVTRFGYTFNRWEPTVPSTVQIENKTYLAKWDANEYNVLFYANDG